MSPIRLITCDVTNTIIRVAGSVGIQYANMASTINREVDSSRLDNSFRAVYKEQVKKYPNFGVTSGLTSYRWWANVVTKTFKAAGNDIPEAELIQLSDNLYQYFTSQDAWEVISEAENTLKDLKNRGFKIGVVSNFDERLDTILENLQLKTYFDFVLASAREKIEKPEAEIFHRALRISGVDAKETLHIGDNILTDYHGATNAGIQGVLLWNKEVAVPSGIESKYVLSQFHDIVKFL